MARVTHVKKAQQRYHTKPVLDENGEQKQVPVMNNRGEQKTTRAGRPVFLRLTERDLERPKPLLRCDYCRTDIQIGTPYKWIEPHGRGTMTRHASCPAWQVWEYSSALSARIAEIQHGEPDRGEIEDLDGVTGWLESKAEEIRALAEEKRESAQNLEDGFGHPTSQSEELTEIADQLDSWADEVEQAEIPDFPEPDDEECPECGGTGQVEIENPDEDDTCGECDGSGQVLLDEPSPEQVEAWKDEAIEVVKDAVGNSPL